MTEQQHPTGESNIREESVTTETEEMAVQTTKIPPHERGSNVAWGAVIAGALLGLTLMAVLNILGLAIGAVTLEAGAGAEGVGIGAGIWWTLSALVGLFFGGWAAGHFSGADIRSEGLLHGIMTWALFVVAGFVAMTTAIGQFVGGAFGFVGQNLAVVLAAIQPTEAVEALMMQDGMDPAVVAEAEAALATAGQQALEAVAIGAGWSFVALLLGVLVCALGGSFGVIEPEERGKKRSKRFVSRLRPQRA